MKKIGAFLLGVGLLAGVTVAADSNTATSVNAVGFVNVTIPASNQYVMVASGFDSITGGVSRTLGDIFGSNSGLRQNINPNKVDKVYLWDVNQQTYIIYGQNIDGLFYLTGAWGGSATNPIVPQGYGFFIKSPTAANGGVSNSIVTLSGQVPTVLTNSLVIPGSTPTAPYQMIANPYPVSVALDSLINTNSGAFGHINPNNCDRVYLWDTAAQTYIILGLKLPDNRWYYTGSWGTLSMPSYNIDPGQGFFYRGKATFTWNVAKPYNWP